MTEPSTATAELRFTDVGEGLVSGEIVRWLVAEGDSVERDQPLVAVETDKSVVELPAPATGVVSRLVGEPGDTVEVGDLLVVIEAVMAAPNGSGQPTSRVKAAPAVRKRAVELGVDLASVTGTGPGGRITDNDLELAAVGSGARRAQQPAREMPLRGVRRRTAEVMARSWSTIPHITAMDEVDASALLDARDRLQSAGGAGSPPLGILPLLVKAVAGALRRHPMMNATIDVDGGRIILHDDCNIGLAVATDDGLLVPVLAGADRRSVRDLAAAIVELAARARARTLTPEELAGATFTVSNYGVFGGRFATPLIRPPEVGIIGFGAVQPRPIVVDGAVVARPTLPVCVSADHRLVDGEGLAAFTADVLATVADPIRLLLDA